jgi:hypothetical protein
MRNDDQQRLIISLGIIATAVAAYAITGPDNAIWILLRSAISIQAALAFIYVIYLASSLKFEGSSSLFDIKIPAKIGKISYDQSIEMFWATIISGALLLAYVTIPSEWREGWMIIGVIALTTVIALIAPLAKLTITLIRKAKK